MVLPYRSGCCIAAALTLLSGCDAPGSSASAPGSAVQPAAAVSSSFFSAVVPAPAAAVSHRQSTAPATPANGCQLRIDPQRFESIACLAGMHTGRTSDGEPCRLMVDLAQRRMTFQAGTTTVSLNHERLAMTAQGEVVYNLEALRDTAGIDGVRLMHLQPAAAQVGQMLTQSITLMAAGHHRPLSWTYAQDGMEPALRVACQGTS